MSGWVRKAAERRVHEVVRSTGEQREQAERELADASQTVDDLENKLDEAAGVTAVLEKRLADMQTSYQAQAIELAQVRERLALVEQAAKAATEQYTAELAKAQSERDSARAEASTAREEAAKLRGQVQALQTQAADQLRALAGRQAPDDIDGARATKTTKAKKPD